MCTRLLEADCHSYAAVKRALERTQTRTASPASSPLTQSGSAIRAITEYQEFWDTHSQTLSPENH